MTGASPGAYMVRFAARIADYNPDERPRTVGVLRNIAVGVLLLCVLLAGVAFLLM